MSREFAPNGEVIQAEETLKAEKTIKAEKERIGKDIEILEALGVKYEKEEGK